MLFLHIGRGKAGSTTIQRSLLANEKLLAERGIFLTDASKKHGGNCAPLAWTLQSDSYKDSPALEEISGFLRQHSDQKVVISSEFLFSQSRQAIETIRDMARGHAVQVLAYLREYPGWFQSLYGQSTRSGKNLANFDAFFDRGWMRCSAVDDLTRWADVFGWENVRVRSLDAECLSGGALLSDFSSVIGVELGGAPQLNTSPHWIEIEFLRELHNADRTLGQDPAFRKELQSVSRHLRTCIDAAPTADARYLRPDQWKMLADLYAEDALVIGHKAGVTIPPRTIKSAERPFLPTLADAPKSVCARFVDRDANSFWRDCHPSIRDAAASVAARWSGSSAARQRLSREISQGTGLASL